MAVWGKLIGAACGTLLFKGPLGLILGLIVGHAFDRGVSIQVKRIEPGAHHDAARIQQCFFETTFWVMGYVAKADGVVSQREIKAAEHFMSAMGLDADLRQQAMRLFYEGKNQSLDLEGLLTKFYWESLQRSDLIQSFLEIQLQAAYADGELSSIKQHLLASMCQILGVSAHDFQRLHAFVRAQQGFSGQQYRQQQQQSHSSSRSSADVQAAYAVLGVSANDDMPTITKAYRRLMNQHHPDKLVAKGLPADMLQWATQKTQEIKTAYQTIKQERQS